jgi:FRG domain-containing protein
MALPGREIRVSSWLELMEKLHFHNIVQLREGEGNHLRSPYVFRGMDDARWELETSLQRLPRTPATRPKVVERSLLRSFRKYASAGVFDQQSEWYILAVGQHNGLPTRCLDWTTSPLVAAHFACGDEKYKDCDGAIWCVDASILRHVNETSNRQIGLRGIAWVYDTRLLERSFLDLEALDSNVPGDLMLLWEPPSLDLRIASQSGLLSIMNDGASSQNAFLERHSQSNPDLVLRIVISASMKSEARDMLDQNNISERSLFPGLPGLCAWLKRYYGTAWSDSSKAKAGTV